MNAYLITLQFPASEYRPALTVTKRVAVVGDANHAKRMYLASSHIAAERIVSIASAS